MQHILKKLQFVPSMEALPEWYEGIVECWQSPKAWLLSGASCDKQGMGNRGNYPPALLTGVSR
jgi:hypothetical protein